MEKYAADAPLIAWRVYGKCRCVARFNTPPHTSSATAERSAVREDGVFRAVVITQPCLQLNSSGHSVILPCHDLHLMFFWTFL